MLSLRRFGGVVAAALVLSIPVFAVSDLRNSQGTPAVPIEAKDDAVSALRIVNQTPATVVRTKDSDDAVVKIQTFENTSKYGSSSQ